MKDSAGDSPWIAQREWAPEGAPYWYESRRDGGRLWIRLVYPIGDNRALYTAHSIAFEALGRTSADRQDILRWIRESLRAETTRYLGGDDVDGKMA